MAPPHEWWICESKVTEQVWIRDWLYSQSAGGALATEKVLTCPDFIIIVLATLQPVTICSLKALWAQTNPKQFILTPIISLSLDTSGHSLTCEVPGSRRRPPCSVWMAQSVCVAVLLHLPFGACINFKELSWQLAKEADESKGCVWEASTKCICFSFCIFLMISKFGLNRLKLNLT